MPLYEYRCNECGYEFEELAKSSEDSATVPCKQCKKGQALRRISRFAPVIAGGSPTETIDMSIGRDAENRWKVYGDRQSKRRGNKPLQDVPQPKTKDGKYMPVMGLGKKEEREKRSEYSVSLQEHRQERMKRNQPQFVGPGKEF
jgi:putative FmdB family regulatory protein